MVRVGADVTQETTRRSRSTPSQQADPTLPIGQTRVVQDGKDGTMIVTYRQRVENGTEGRPADHLRGAVGRAHAEDHRLRHLRRPALGRAGDVRVGRSLGHRRLPTPTATTAASASTVETWLAFGGGEFAPNAGLATREQQIIVGMRIYNKLGWDPWGCANNVLHWPQWSM